MTDPNLNDFKGRVARIQEARENGYGFEATGTLGRSYYHRPAAQRWSVVRPVVFLLLCVFVLKGAVYRSVGADVYNERVAELHASAGIGRIGAWMMQPEPGTLLVADLITYGLGKLK
jgi:hypothetical protein